MRSTHRLLTISAGLFISFSVGCAGQAAQDGADENAAALDGARYLLSCDPDLARSMPGTVNDATPSLIGFQAGFTTSTRCPTATGP
jgi:hypothetical protein